MPTGPLAEDLTNLLSKPNPAVIATVQSNGQPVTVPTWYLLDGDRILVNMDAERKRINHMRAEPRISLTVLADGDWYTHVSVQGRVVELTDDLDLAGIDRISRHYNGNVYPVRDRPRVNAWIDIDRVHRWGQGSTTAWARQASADQS